MDQAGHSADGLSFKAYRGDSCTLLAFDLAEQHADDLAGFAVEYTDPAGRTHPVLNRLSFDRRKTHNGRSRKSGAASSNEVSLWWPWSMAGRCRAIPQRKSSAISR